MHDDGDIVDVDDAAAFDVDAGDADDDVDVDADFFIACITTMTRILVFITDHSIIMNYTYNHDLQPQLCEKRGNTFQAMPTTTLSHVRSMLFLTHGEPRSHPEAGSKHFRSYAFRSAFFAHCLDTNVCLAEEQWLLYI